MMITNCVNIKKWTLQKHPVVLASGEAGESRNGFSPKAQSSFQPSTLRAFLAKVIVKQKKTFEFLISVKANFSKAILSAVFLDYFLSATWPGGTARRLQSYITGSTHGGSRSHKHRVAVDSKRKLTPLSPSTPIEFFFLI